MRRGSTGITLEPIGVSLLQCFESVHKGIKINFRAVVKFYRCNFVQSVTPPRNIADVYIYIIVISY